MTTPTLSHIKRFFVYVLCATITTGAAVTSFTVSADSTVKAKPQVVERNKFEKKLPPTVQEPSSPASVQAMTVEQSRERYIISLLNEPVARYRGGVKSYTATSTEGVSKLDVHSPAAEAYASYLSGTQDKLLQAMAEKLGRSVKPVGQFQITSNALIVELTRDEAIKASQLSGVGRITKDKNLRLHTSSLDASASAPTHNRNTSFLAIIAVFSLPLLALLIYLAYRRRWLGRNSAVIAIFASTVAMTGCLYKGGFQWIGAPEIWFGSQGLTPTRGEGVIVGVIDTGINPISDSFAEVDGDGYRHKNPKDHYLGACDPNNDIYDETFPCNDKLIGAWSYDYIEDGTPRDYYGHGSHTASTAAGNLVYDATLTTPTGLEISKTISGVAPHANIIAYKVCNEYGGCYLSAAVSAIEQAVIDGVDVINYSLGFGYSNPWQGEDALSFLAAMDAGIFVAVAAGNNGPASNTIKGSETPPWVTTTASSSHNYVYENSLVGMINDEGEALPDIIGRSVTSGFGPAKVIDATHYGNPLCLDGQFNAKLNGEIVLCEMERYTYVDNVSKSVTSNGGGAIIFTMPPLEADGSGYLKTSIYDIPTTLITYADATVLREWMSHGSGHLASLSGTSPIIANHDADVLSYDSSRGGAKPETQSILKPNITAPGQAIFAAWAGSSAKDERDYNIYEGTSMASPHIAGAAALLTALHPNWTPMQIQSAIMTTATTHIKKEDDSYHASPLDIGAGRIVIPSAARAALLADESYDNFIAADPLKAGDPATLNLAGLSQTFCIVNCSWTRTLTNVSDKQTQWQSMPAAGVTVSPKRFSLAPGESIELSFAADVTSVDTGEWLFDQVLLLSETEGVPHAHFPVAAQSAVSKFPEAIDITADKESDVVTLAGLKAIDITDAEVTLLGLKKSTVFQGAVISDPTNDALYDGNFDPLKDGVSVFVVDVPVGSSRFIAEISDSASVDLDLYIGTGETPSEDTTVASAYTASALEYLSVNNPTAGKMWVLVQNWEPGYVDPQAFTLHVTSVNDDEGNMTITVPVSQPRGEAFSADINFTLPGSVAGDHYYGAFSLGTDTGSPGNLGTILIDLVRE